MMILERGYRGRTGFPGAEIVKLTLEGNRCQVVAASEVRP